jgi:Holliday junction resolvase RusA-like endonuclease
MTGCDLPLISTPCKFFCTSYFPTPESMPNADKLLAEMGLIRPISKPDWDNVGKAYSDMIQGTLLFDDSLIVEGISKKFYSVKPRIEIHIEYMEEHDCKYNENKLRKKV